MVDEEILLVTWWKGNTLTHNIHALGIDADNIDKVAFSQGHRDRTDELVSFLEARTEMTPLRRLHTCSGNRLG
jgi:metal-dependent hydrolase (beta-lactamase superfamily II)